LVNAQQAVCSLGGDASGSGGSVAYSVGQVVYSTYSGVRGTEAQGVQQAYEFYNLSLEEKATKIVLSVFPNPAYEHITLHISDFNNEKLMYQLFDLHGKIVRSEVVISHYTLIDLTILPSSTYFFIVTNQVDNTFESFKIIKT
jgi:hypothetical protein